jgi:hypothetical protein
MPVSTEIEPKFDFNSATLTLHLISTKVGYMFGQIGATGRKVRGHVRQKWPNFENFVWTKMGGFGKFWDQTFMGIIPGPFLTQLDITITETRSNQKVYNRIEMKHSCLHCLHNDIRLRS